MNLTKLLASRRLHTFIIPLYYLRAWSHINSTQANLKHIIWQNKMCTMAMHFFKKRMCHIYWEIQHINLSTSKTIFKLWDAIWRGRPYPVLIPRLGMDRNGLPRKVFLPQLFSTRLEHSSQHSLSTHDGSVVISASDVDLGKTEAQGEALKS